MKVLSEIPQDELTDCDRVALSSMASLISSSVNKLAPNNQEIQYLKYGDGYYQISRIDRDLWPKLITSEKVRHLSDRKNSINILCFCQKCKRDGAFGYMLNKPLWISIADDPKGMMCLSCVEKELGPLKASFFDMSIPINAANLHYLKPDSSLH